MHGAKISTMCRVRLGGLVAISEGAKTDTTTGRHDASCSLLDVQVLDDVYLVRQLYAVISQT